MNLTALLNENAPKDLYRILSKISSCEDLMKEIPKCPTLALDILLNMKLVGNESLASRLLIQIPPNDYEKPELRKVETTLRNLGFQISVEPDLILTNSSSSFTLGVHKSILSLESPFIMGARSYKAFEQGMVIINNLEDDPTVYDYVMYCIYASDAERRKFIAAVEVQYLIKMAVIADYLCHDFLKNLCDDTLCTSLFDIHLENDVIENLLESATCYPKFSALLEFIRRIANEEGSLETVLNLMKTPEGIPQLAAKCTSLEIKIFSTLETEFGKECLMPSIAFGKTAWEKYFIVEIHQEEPPLPPKIHAILDRQDPWEPTQKLRETCFLFLRPDRFINMIQDDKEMLLDFDAVEQLGRIPAKINNISCYDRSAACVLILNYLQKDKIIPLAEAGWVLMRKTPIPGAGKSYNEQLNLLDEHFETPKLMDAILLHILSYASKGEVIFENSPCKYTYCQETMVEMGDPRILTGNFFDFDPDRNYRLLKMLLWHSYSDGNIDGQLLGLLPCWNFNL